MSALKELAAEMPGPGATDQEIQAWRQKAAAVQDAIDARVLKHRVENEELVDWRQVRARLLGR